MMSRSLLLLACLAAAVVAPAIAQAQAPAPAVGDPGYVDPNQQTEGISASLDGVKLKGNPLNLTAPPNQGDQSVPPQGGFTMTSPHSTDATGQFSEEMWSWEFDGYNVEFVGLTTMHNLKDPKWPVVWTIFTNASDTQFAPLVIDFVNITWLDEVARNLTDGKGNKLGYTDFLNAGNDSAFGVIARMGNDPTQAIFGVLGNDLTSADQLVGGINEPINDDTYVPLTPDQLANLPDPNALRQQYENVTSTGTVDSSGASTSAPATSTPSEPSSSPPKSAGIAIQAGMSVVAAVMAGAVLLLC